MAEQKSRAAGVAVGISTSAAIMAAFALARKVKAAEGGIVELPQELWDLIIAIAGSLENLYTAIRELQLNVQGWPPNAQGTRSFSIVCVAANTAYHAADMVIPSGMLLMIKAWPFNAVGSLVFVATSSAECVNLNSSWPLLRNEPVAYAVENANAFFVSSNVAGSIVIFSVERRS